MQDSRYDVEAVRRDFPILGTRMNGKPLVYLDSAATSQKPVQVLKAMDDYYREYNANIHRGIYRIAEEATERYIDSKNKVARFINAQTMHEIIYVRNATEAINLAALTWGNANVNKGDHIAVSEMEHHSNLVPWMLLAKRKGAALDYVKLDSKKEQIDMQSFDAILEHNPKLVAVSHESNVLGTINEVKEISRRAHKAGALVLVDGAQSAPHMPVDVRDIDADFFAFSAHKMLGPTGIGALYGKRELLESMEPLNSGGDMIKSVEYDSYTWNELPWKFEAGTSDIAGGIGFGAAIDYLDSIGMAKIRSHELELTFHAMKEMEGIRGITVYGPSDAGKRGGVVSFSMDDVHPHDVAQVFDSEGIAIRAGHHCAMPLVRQRLGVPALSRMSFYLYNTKEEVDFAVGAIGKVKKVFNKGE